MAMDQSIDRRLALEKQFTVIRSAIKSGFDVDVAQLFSHEWARVLTHDEKALTDLHNKLA